MINSSLSECNHKCETRNADPEMGTDRLAKHGEIRGLMGTGRGVACHESVGWVLGWVLNRTDPLLQSKAEPLACYLDPLITLETTPYCQIPCYLKPIFTLGNLDCPFAQFLPPTRPLLKTFLAKEVSDHLACLL